MRVRTLAVVPFLLVACSKQDDQPQQPPQSAKQPAAHTAKEAAHGGKESAGKQQVVSADYMKPTDERRFTIEYVGKISEVPAGTKKLRVWMPVPQDSTVQKISDLSFSKEPKIETEAKYGNKIAYWEMDAPGATAELTMKFTCTRTGYHVDLDKLQQDGEDPASAFSVFEKPDKLVIVDDNIKKMAADITKGKDSTIEKSRAIYDYVVGHMVYDKSGQGWGTGSTQFACDVGKGNCTDFHALFNSLERAAGIASGFEIGLYLPYERKKDEKLGGYHCWAYFRVPGKTWVPVDCSEGMKIPDRKEFMFGGHTSNRVALSTGRDLVLEPEQAGDRLNYFLNPYAEADGKPVKTDKTWSFQDLDS